MILTPTEEERAIIAPLVAQFQADLDGKRLIPTFQNSLLSYIRESSELQELIHSIRHRLKDPDHLADKLIRKIREAKKIGAAFGITTANIFTAINDLAGVRLLHLHTSQMADIDRCLKEIFAEQKVDVIEGPTARTWDNEYKSYFTSIGIGTQDSETMYTSVHYLVASKSSTTVTCEIQVRTLMEEVWGEVDHKINYPHKNEHVACREQLRALARSTSSATRLVDSIFATVVDLESKKNEK